jgi:hypothetical protein
MPPAGFCEILYPVIWRTSIHRSNQNMIAIVVVRPNVILGRQDLFSPQIELSVCLFWENMTYYRKNYPFSPTFKLCSNKLFAKGKTDRVISYRDKNCYRIDSFCGMESFWSCCCNFCRVSVAQCEDTGPLNLIYFWAIPESASLKTILLFSVR